MIMATNIENDILHLKPNLLPEKNELREFHFDFIILNRTKLYQMMDGTIENGF